MNVYGQFLYRLQDHYLWLLGLLFMIEPALDYWIESYRTWADTYVSRRLRTRAAITISIVAAFIACFLAFRDQFEATVVANAEKQTVIGERDEARRQRDQKLSPDQQFAVDRLSGDLVAARGQIDSQKQKIEQQQMEISSQRKEIEGAQNDLKKLKATYARRHLTDEQKQKISRIAKSHGGVAYKVKLFEPNSCTDCDEYGSEFAAFFKGSAMEWTVVGFEQDFGGINPKFRGLALLVADKDSPPPAALALAGAFNFAKIAFSVDVARGMLKLKPDEVGLLIGPKN